MIRPSHDKFISAIFITFSGNCKKALSFYQACFGGILHFETFEKEIPGYAEMPVVNGSLISDRVIIYGSDLVHHEGRKLGNYLSIFLHCENKTYRKELVEKLESDRRHFFANHDHDQKLIEVIDAFDVRWVLGI